MEATYPSLLDDLNRPFRHFGFGFPYYVSFAFLLLVRVVALLTRTISGMTKVTPVAELKPGDRHKTIEAKVYRKWVAKPQGTRNPITYSCILLDKCGDAIQANMNYGDQAHFDSILHIGSAYTISDFYCQDTPKWQPTLAHPATLRFGQYTKFHAIPADDFPAHYFQFVSYNQLRGRTDKQSLLADYIGCVENVSQVITTKDPNRNERSRRTIDLINLNNDALQVTLWNDEVTKFDVQAYEALDKPVMLVVTSCAVKIYYKQVQLTATSATHFYLNPDISEFNESIDQYRAIFSSHVTLEIDKHIYDDPIKEKRKNRYPLAQILETNLHSYIGAKFSCEAVIEHVIGNKDWYYTACSACNEKLLGEYPDLECLDHGPQSTPRFSYCFKTLVTDGSTRAFFTFFTPQGDKILNETCHDIVVKEGYTDPRQLPPHINFIEGTTHIFQFHYNARSTKGYPEFIVDRVFNISDDVCPTVTPAAETGAHFIAELKNLSFPT